MKSIQSLDGIGKKRAEFFFKKGIKTVDDLLYFFPRDYEDRTKTLLIEDLYEDAKACVTVKILSPVKEARIRKNMSIYSLKATDESGVMSIIWYNNRFVKGVFRTGEEYVFFGKVTKNKGMWEMVNPIYEKKGLSEGKIMPIYSINDSITQKAVQSATLQAIEDAKSLEDYIPEAIRAEHGLLELGEALSCVHYPKDFSELKRARERFAFEELYLLQTALLLRKTRTKKEKRKPFSDTLCRDEFMKMLPFSLTNAQKRVVDEIACDFKKDTPMMRLCQGDVGSGKTAVSAVAIYMAIKNGYQSSIMVPTEILANQHYETFVKFFEKTPIRTELLTSSTKNKKEVLEKIKAGEVDLVIGTHAIIQKGVEFCNLGLVIADEQHRFGVTQRAELFKKGENPHFLVMSATPIPRTLALILYGDLDVSIIDELPPGRKEVKTYAVGEDMKKRVEDFIRKNVKEGSQCYVVCPLVEESEKMDLKNATDLALYYEMIFPELKVGLIHGRMKAGEKEQVMSDFVDKKIDILVSTTVIEVGVNVPTSNIMIIQNAERFGLSQLHQLRGRVGRGMMQSYCILFYENLSTITKKRLEVMCKTNDGFLISQEDLKLRGPGDFFGTRQHGLPDFKIANLFSDMMLLKKAQNSAEKTISGEYEISKEERVKLVEKLDKVIPDDVIIN